MPVFFRSYLFYTLIGFVSGSIMYSYSLPRILRGIDVRDAAPDRNPGGANAVAAAGKAVGLLCIALDVLKAFLPVYAAVTYAGIRGAELIPVAAAPVLGHAFSPLLRFRGGKAVSAFYGVLLALWPVTHLVVFPAAAMVVFKFLIIVGPDSLCVFISLFVSCFAVLFLEPDPMMRIAFFAVQAVVLYKTVRNPNRDQVSIRVGKHTFLTADSFMKLRRP